MAILVHLEYPFISNFQKLSASADSDNTRRFCHLNRMLDRLARPTRIHFSAGSKMKKGFFSSKNEAKNGKPAPMQEDNNQKKCDGEGGQNRKCLSHHLQVVVSESSSKRVKLVSSNKVEGRFLEAVSSFAAGDVILTADYFATVSDQSNPELCTRCLCRVKKERCVCGVCGSTFCSQNCKDLSSAGSNLSNPILIFIKCDAPFRNA
jgi:hypothetical protein